MTVSTDSRWHLCTRGWPIPSVPGLQPQLHTACTLQNWPQEHRMLHGSPDWCFPYEINQTMARAAFYNDTCIVTLKSVIHQPQAHEEGGGCEDKEPGAHLGNLWKQSSSRRVQWPAHKQSPPALSPCPGAEVAGVSQAAGPCHSPRVPSPAPTSMRCWWFLQEPLLALGNASHPFHSSFKPIFLS